MNVPQKLETFSKKVNHLGVIVKMGQCHWEDLSREELHFLRHNLMVFLRTKPSLGLHHSSEFCIVSCMLICLFYS